MTHGQAKIMCTDNNNAENSQLWMRYSNWQSYLSELGKMRIIGKGVISLVLALLCINLSAQGVGSHYVDVVSCDSLTVYYPNITRIDLATGTMPAKSEGGASGWRFFNYSYKNAATPLQNAVKEGIRPIG